VKGDLVGGRLDRPGLPTQLFTHVFTVQLSIDESQPPSFHFDIGRKLAPLHSEGVLIVGRGNLPARR
jgi:hypothetical protein